tara:strand:- start:2077 stop:2748 length:672 start_codon:yes stop_codon:yes gene_type:complete
MKDIINDLKIIISNNYTLFVLSIVLAIGVNYIPWYVVVPLALLAPITMYILLHNITKVAFNHIISLPDRTTAGWRLVKNVVKWWVIILSPIAIVTVFFSYVFGSDSGSNSTVSILNYSGIIIDIIFAILISYFYVKDLCIFIVGLFPDTKELSYFEDLVSLKENFPSHINWFIIPCSIIYYVDNLVGWVTISYVCVAYTLRYILGTPPKPKEKVKVLKTCDNL